MKIGSEIKFPDSQSFNHRSSNIITWESPILTFLMWKFTCDRCRYLNEWQLKSSCKYIKINNHLLVLQDHYSDLVTLSGLNQTFIVTMSGFVWDPARLLWVIRLGLELHLQLRWDNQPWGWIWVRSFAFLDMSGHCVDSRVCWSAMKSKN